MKKVTVLIVLFLFFSVLPSSELKAERIVPGVPLFIGTEVGGKNLSATLDLSSGKVKVYGEGFMKPNVGEETLRWFYGYEKEVKEVEIAKGVKSIGDYAFGGDTQANTKGKLPNLSKVSFANTVEKIGAGAFYGAKSLREIEIPGSVKVIGSQAFNLAVNLSKVTLHEGLETIENGAFMNCTSLHSIIIPNGISSIPENVFYRNLQEITLPKTLKVVKANAFQGQINATIYSIDTTIEENAFPVGSIITCYKDSLTEKSAIEKGNLVIEHIKEKSSVIKSPKPNVKVKRRKLIIKCASVSNAVGYQIRYSKNKNMKGAKIVNKKTYISKKLEAGSVYYVQARAYDTIIKDKIKGKWSKKVKVTIK